MVIRRLGLRSDPSRQAPRDTASHRCWHFLNRWRRAVRRGRIRSTPTFSFEYIVVRGLDSHYDLQPATGTVFGADTSAVHPGNPLSDCQPESHTPRFTVARIGHPIERSKDVCQLRRRHSGTAVRYTNDRRIPAVGAAAFQIDLDRSSRCRIANGVADDVLCCAPEQIRIHVERTLAVAD